MLSLMVVLRFRVVGIAAAFSALLLLGSCSGADSATLEHCTPLDAQASAPIELGRVVTTGRSEDGTLYLVDEHGSDFRVFVSDGDIMQRHVVDGSGESTHGDATSVSLTVSDLDLLLKITVDGTGNVRMGAYYGAAGKRDFQIGEEGEELEVLDERAIEGVPLRNLSGDITIEYWAESEDGRLLLVTRPTNDWDYEDFRLFFGPRERIDERKVTSVARERDGGTTTIEFSAEGSATAHFPAPSRNQDSTLSLNGNEQTLTLLSSDPADSNAGFRCR